MGHEDLLAEGAVTLAEAEVFTGLRKSTLYGLMDRGELQYVKVGRARRIPRRALVALLVRHLRGGGRDDSGEG